MKKYLADFKRFQTNSYHQPLPNKIYVQYVTKENSKNVADGPFCKTVKVYGVQLN